MCVCIPNMGDATVVVICGDIPDTSYASCKVSLLAFYISHDTTPLPKTSFKTLLALAALVFGSV